MKRKSFYMGLGSLVLFIIWTVALRFVDVGAIGPQGSSVGFATLNKAIHNITGVHMSLYTITDWLGLIPICFIMGFGILGLCEWIKRRNPFRVDYSLLTLGGFYIVVMAAYILFEIFVVNYRPILINGILEASYPSSTTMLVMCVMPTAIMQLNDRIKNRGLSRCCSWALCAFTAFMVIGRLLSGVHWVSDIIGGAIFSSGLVLIYYSIQLSGEKEMIKKDYLIRLERKEDYPVVENLIREAFWNVYRPGCLEHYLITRLREHPDFVKELDFVMEKNGKIIGQNVFVKANIKADDGRDIPILTMGPICITPELKRKGYGKALLDYSLENAAKLGFGAVLFEGNIGFYGKSGFDYAHKFGIRYHDLPEDADSSFFLCKELVPGYLDGITGVYQTPQGYYVDDADVEEFDKDFPHKEKLKLPGQIF